MNESGGTKYDMEKPDFSLIDAEWLEEVAKVMTFGKRKYDAHNWRKGIVVSRLLSAALRHLWATVRGEDNDPETGLSHLAHLSCCVMFAFWHLKHRKDLDDRYIQQDYGKVSSSPRPVPRTGMGLGQPVAPNKFADRPDNCAIAFSIRTD